MISTLATHSNHTPRIGLYSWFRYVFHQIELTAPRITLIYAVFGMCALFLSDVLFVRYFSEPLLSQVQALKGGVEVVLTAGLIFLLTRRSRGQLKDASEQVERQRDELRLLHRVLRHNLRNDLNVIQGQAGLARDEVSGTPTETRCRKIIEKTQKVVRYAEQARQIRKVSEGTSQRQTIDLSETIRRVMNEHPQITDSVEVTARVSDGVQVRANPKFDLAFREILTNAIKHNDADPPTITIGLDVDDKDPQMVELRIRDNGPGIPESEIKALYNDRESQLLHSEGMGIWYVDWVVAHSDGELRILRADAGGTEVQILLPKAHKPPFDLPGLPELT